MRYINIADIELPEGWLEKAEGLKERLSLEPDMAKKAAIMDDNEIWQELFLPLSKLSKGKCWYSEARDIMSDRDIDHFRPKNEALNEDNSKREGYWWLCYDWNNYRFSSIYSNQKRKDKYNKKSKTGGKGAYFPLFAGSAIALNVHRLADEDIMLLDPTDPHDPPLLTFDESGKAIPNSTNPKERERVRVSVWLYNLDHTPLEEERARLWSTCKRLINRIDNIKSRPDFGAADKAILNSLKDELKDMLKIDQELSAVAIACCEKSELSYLARI